MAAATTRDQWAETAVGAVVLAAAAAFLVYALGHVGGLKAGGGYELIARFGEVGALAPGADVRVAGVKVGSVARVELDPKTFLAKTVLAIEPGVDLPSDSTAKITSDGLLGGSHVSIAPGGAAENLKAGGEFQNTQGAVDLFGLIGKMMRPDDKATGDGAPASADPYPGD